MRGLTLLLVAFAQLSSCVLANQHSMPQVKCIKNGDVCIVSFSLIAGTDEKGEQHSVEMIREKEGLFAVDAVLELEDGQTRPLHHERRLAGVRYHSHLQNKHYATALISNDGTKVLEGVFATTKHGFYEYNHGTDPQPVLRRTLQTLEDIVLVGPTPRPSTTSGLTTDIGDSGSSVSTGGDTAGSAPSMPPTVADTAWTTKVANAAPNTIIPFFPGCFPQDSVTHVLKVNVILDAGVVASLSQGVSGDASSKVLTNLESVFAPGKLIYLAQLNVRLEIGYVLLGSSSMASPINGYAAKGTCLTATAAMDQFMYWISQVKPANQTGYWILASNCFSTINGVSYIGSLCGSTNNGGVAAYSWPVMFHELGHGFGMSHSFENGVGLTGGLMDYGDTLYNGVSQFHPNKRVEACTFLTTVKADKCKYFQMAAVNTTCGDGILVKDEQCECMDRSTNCGKCVRCKLTDASIECASSTYLVRNSLTEDIVVVEASALADSKCCINGTFAPPKTLCGDNNLDACGANGACAQVCTALLEVDNANCGFDDTGCLMGCVWKNKCDFSLLKSVDSNALINWLPDGSKCSWNGVSGYCTSGECSSKPTTAADYITRVPSFAPFSNPVYTSRTPTAYPIKKTKKPTSFPSRAPTLSPDSSTDGDPAAHLDPNAKCIPFKKMKVCKKRGCQWCSGSCKYSCPSSSKTGRRLVSMEDA